MHLCVPLCRTSTGSTYNIQKQLQELVNKSKECFKELYKDFRLDYILSVRHGEKIPSTLRLDLSPTIFLSIPKHNRLYHKRYKRDCFKNL